MEDAGARGRERHFLARLRHRRGIGIRVNAAVTPGYDARGQGGAARQGGRGAIPDGRRRSAPTRGLPRPVAAVVRAPASAGGSPRRARDAARPAAWVSAPEPASESADPPIPVPPPHERRPPAVFHRPPRGGAIGPPPGSRRASNPRCSPGPGRCRTHGAGWARARRLAAIRARYVPASHPGQRASAGTPSRRGCALTHLLISRTISGWDPMALGGHGLGRRPAGAGRPDRGAAAEGPEGPRGGREA